MLDIVKEELIFRERLENGFYSLDRAKNCGSDYVKSGKLDRDTKAVIEYAGSKEFDAIKALR